MISSYTVKQPSPSSPSHNSSQTQDPHSCSPPASSSSAGSLGGRHSLVYPRIEGTRRVQRTLGSLSLPTPKRQSATQIINPCQSIRDSRNRPSPLPYLINAFFSFRIWSFRLMDSTVHRWPERAKDSSNRSACLDQGRLPRRAVSCGLREGAKGGYLGRGLWGSNQLRIHWRRLADLHINIYPKLSTSSRRVPSAVVINISHNSSPLLLVHLRHR